MTYQYKVVPFLGRTRGGVAADEVSRQLESTINSEADSGWEFYQLGDINIEVSPGCLASLFGAQVSYIRFDQVIFRRPTEEEKESASRRSSKERAPGATSEPMPPGLQGSESQASSDILANLSSEAIAALQKARSKGYQVHVSPDRKSVILESGDWRTSLSSEAEIIQFARAMRK
jgi:hypothetical protein